MLKTNIPLVTFYENLLKEVKRTGYLIVITLLAREADAPQVYLDLCEHWSSIHNLTRNKILFVVSAPGANKILFNNEYIWSRPKAFGIKSSCMAVAKNLTWNFKRASLISDLHRGTPRIKKDKFNLEDHSLQISELTDFLGILENDLPCLHILYLNDTNIETDLLHIDLTVSIYEMIKHLTEHWIPFIKKIEDIKYELKKISNSNSYTKPLDINDKLKEIIQHGKSNPALFDFSKEFIEIISQKRFEKDDKKRCYKIKSFVSRETGATHPILNYYQSVTDLRWKDSFKAISIPSNIWNVKYYDISEVSEIKEDKQYALRNDLTNLLNDMKIIPKYLGEKTDITKNLLSKHDNSVIFISYAKEDYHIACTLYNDLKNNGFNPWIDHVNLFSGQNWKYKITYIIKRCRFFIVLLSSNSVLKSGYFQKELKIALDIFDEMPNNKIFLIPVKVDDFEYVPEKLVDIHWADISISYEKGLMQIKEAIKSSL